jgi:hypothetical protein
MRRLSSEVPSVIPTPIPDGECQLMAELSIVRDGRQYLHDGYCYDRLSDAVAYAELRRGQARQPGPSSPPRFELVGSPTASDRQLMTELSISFENGRFVFEGYRYDRLSDAVSYAHYRRSIAAPR